MKELKNEELLRMEGGINISGTLLNSIYHVIESILDVGRSLGSALRRLHDGNVCDIK